MQRRVKTRLSKPEINGPNLALGSVLRLQVVLIYKFHQIFYLFIIKDYIINANMAVNCTLFNKIYNVVVAKIRQVLTSRARLRG